MSDDRPNDLEISEDLRHEKKAWRAHFVAGVVATLILLLALLGLFGTGPISWATARGDAGRLSVDYERFLRRTGVAELQVHVDAAAAEQGEFEVLIDRGYLDRFTISTITPQPDTVESLPDDVRFTFLAGAPDADLDVSFSLRPTGLWRLHGEVEVPGDDAVDFWQFTFP